MKTELHEAMTAGVFVEFRDATGNTIGQALYTDWHGRPVPGVGDVLACDAQAFAGPTVHKLVGRVVSRQFEVQREVDGSPCVWVHLVAETRTGAAVPMQSPRATIFSRN